MTVTRPAWSAWLTRLVWSSRSQFESQTSARQRWYAMKEERERREGRDSAEMELLYYLCAVLQSLIAIGVPLRAPTRAQSYFLGRKRRICGS